MTLASLDRVRRTFLTGLAFLLFLVGAAVLACVVLPLVHLRGLAVRERERRCRLLVRRVWLLFHDFVRLSGLLRYNPRSVRLLLPDGPFVLVANHPTLIDVTALVAAIPDVVFVAKPSVFRSPVIGPVLGACGHMEAGDGPFSGAAVLEGALERLARGTPVLIFPEGTRSPPGGVRTMRSGAFEIAARAGVPVVAACIRCEPPTLARGERWYQVPDRPPVLTVTQLATRQVSPGQAAEAARRLEAECAAQLACALPPAPPATGLPVPLDVQ